MTTPTERLINAGEPITLKCAGEVRVRELTLEQIILIAGDLAVVLKKLPVAGEAADAEGKSDAGWTWLIAAIKQPETLAALRKVAAATCSVEPVVFKDAGISDWMKWASAVKKVVDWEELRELFTDLLPTGMISTLMEQQKAPAISSTSSQPSTGG